MVFDLVPYGHQIERGDEMIEQGVTFLRSRPSFLDD
jgi:hypothetical protein